MKLKSQGEEFKQVFPGILIKENEENFTKLLNFLTKGIFLWTVTKEDVKINATFKLIMNRFQQEYLHQKDYQVCC